MKRLHRATLASLRGLYHGLQREAALREEAIVLALAVPFGLLVAPSWAWYVAMIAALVAILSIELLNTAIEKLADFTTRERHPEIGAIKDYGSGAVFCMLCIATLLWASAAIVRIRMF
jgi:diacylglycerol kinase (ATP)